MGGRLAGIEARPQRARHTEADRRGRRYRSSCLPRRRRRNAQTPPAIMPPIITTMATVIPPSIVALASSPNGCAFQTLPGPVGPQSLDDPPFRALDLVDLEADAGQIVEWFPHQVVGHEADEKWLKESLYTANGANRASDVL
jgi:hypothetical protein